MQKWTDELLTRVVQARRDKTLDEVAAAFGYRTKATVWHMLRVARERGLCTEDELRGRNREPTPLQLQIIARAEKRDKTIPQIAKELKMHRNTVSRILRNRAPALYAELLVQRHGQFAHVKPCTVQRMIDNGMSAIDIAKQFGVAHGTVYNFIHRNKLEYGFNGRDPLHKAGPVRLRQLYIDQQMAASTIGLMFSVDETAVHDYLVHHNITRP